MRTKHELTVLYEMLIERYEIEKSMLNKARILSQINLLKWILTEDE